jgi:FtsP/CotA-like multicopper oxidase with cupredoxin domain
MKNFRYCAGIVGAMVLMAPAALADDPNAAGFPQPQMRRSSGGVLDTVLRAHIVGNEMVDQLTGETRLVYTPTYAGTIPGPTLVLTPGDTLEINHINSLPLNPSDQRDGRFPHDLSSLNFHTHGLQVSPSGISDNIFRVMAPGSRSRIEVEIPSDHPSGTYWYHPHVHGAVTYQFVAGMAGFLIIKGGTGTLDDLPEIKAAKDLVMGFQVIRSDLQGKVPFVNQHATQFGTFPFGTMEPTMQGVWSTFGLDGAPGRSNFYFTINGVTNPTLHMRPGEVQRWRLLDAAQGENLVLSLQNHGLHVVAMDGITASSMTSLPPDVPLVMSPGQRYDVLVKAGAPGTYELEALDPALAASVSPSGIDPAPRNSRMSFDFPSPCSPILPVGNDCTGQLTYPFPLVTIIVDGDPVDMRLPEGPLPAPAGLPSVDTMLNTPPHAVRHVAFEICGQVAGTQLESPQNRLPSCEWYFARYATPQVWGGAPFYTLEMLRDDDDKGTPTSDSNMPLVNFRKEGLFTVDQPLFPDMIAGNYEEWTVVNRTFSDHPFHIHQNHFLVTKINGKTLAVPEWHDTIIVPAAQPQPTNFLPPPPQPNINTTPFGSITFKIYFNPVSVGCFVMHCHILTHEDLGMMQRLDVRPGPNQSSQCDADEMARADNSSGLSWLYAMVRPNPLAGRWPMCVTP